MKTTTAIRIAAAAALMAAAAARAEVSPWYLGVLGTIEHDTNVFRVGDNQTLPAGYSQADIVFTASVIGGLDQQISRQHLTGSMSLNSARFRNNSYLDNHGYSLKLGLDWEAAERLSGSLTASADQNLAQFNNRAASGVVETTKNVQNIDQVDAKFALGTVTRLSFDADLRWTKRRYSADIYNYLEYNERRAALGAKYRTSGALRLGAAYRATKTDYPNFLVLQTGDQVASHVDREDLDFTAEWSASGASNLYLRISPTHISYDNVLAQSRSEVTGALNWNWQPTGRSTLKAAFSRDTGQSAQAYNLGIFGSQVVDYASMTTALKLSGEYELTGKVTLNASITNAYRDLSNTVVLVGNKPTLAQGSDRSIIPTLGAVWNPTRSAQLGCNFSHERRTTSDTRLSVPLTAGIYSCYGQLVLQ